MEAYEVDLREACEKEKDVVFIEENQVSALNTSIRPTDMYKRSLTI